MTFDPSKTNPDVIIGVSSIVSRPGLSCAFLIRGTTANATGHCLISAKPSVVTGYQLVGWFVAPELIGTITVYACLDETPFETSTTVPNSCENTDDSDTYLAVGQFFLSKPTTPTTSKPTNGTSGSSTGSSASTPTTSLALPSPPTPVANTDRSAVWPLILVLALLCLVGGLVFSPWLVRGIRRLRVRRWLRIHKGFDFVIGNTRDVQSLVSMGGPPESDESDR
jgi:hypothetical protein